MVAGGPAFSRRSCFFPPATCCEFSGSGQSSLPSILFRTLKQLPCMRNFVFCYSLDSLYVLGSPVGVRLYRRPPLPPATAAMVAVGSRSDHSSHLPLCRSFCDNVKGSGSPVSLGVFPAKFRSPPATLSMAAGGGGLILHVLMIIDALYI